YQFCCRNDPFDSDEFWPIQLPNSKPFYLFRHASSTCQAVAGMAVTTDKIRFDEKDDPNHERTGAVPYDPISRNQYSFQLCYYYPLNYGCNYEITLDENNPSATIQTPNYPNNYNPEQICNWFIKAPQEARVNVYFETFDVHGGLDGVSNHETNCKDFVEIRQSLPGQKGIKVCGGNMSRSWIAETNLMWLTL
ncbi:unnamed protein product, partial [Owenia fusiformis]